jgi:hypothetical protein
MFGTAKNTKVVDLSARLRDIPLVFLGVLSGSLEP